MSKPSKQLVEEIRYKLVQDLYNVLGIPVLKTPERLDILIDKALTQAREQGRRDWKTKVKEAYDAGYRMGVHDEIKCVETAGEHLDLQKKLKATLTGRKAGKQK